MTSFEKDDSSENKIKIFAKHNGDTVHMKNSIHSISKLNPDLPKFDYINYIEK